MQEHIAHSWCRNVVVQAAGGGIFLCMKRSCEDAWCGNIIVQVAGVDIVLQVAGAVTRAVQVAKPLSGSFKVCSCRQAFGFLQVAIKVKEPTLV